jgi:hypothetical protein
MGKPSLHVSGGAVGILHLSSVVHRVMMSIANRANQLRKTPDEKGGAAPYIDDLVVGSTIDEHTNFLIDVIDLFTENNLTLNLDKCKFGFQSLASLGSVVSGLGKSPDPVKASEASQFPTPTSGREIESFLGLVNFFCDSIPLFAAISQPLRKIQGLKDLTGVWTDKHQLSFDTLKRLLEAAPVLHHPDFSRPFFVGTDYSTNGIGAVLYQLSPEY